MKSSQPLNLFQKKNTSNSEIGFPRKIGGKWDRQIEMDSESGKLDFLVKEALDEKHMGKLKDL